MTTNDVTIWRIRVACWIRKITRALAFAHTHAAGHARTNERTYTRPRAHTEKYVILIAFLWQQ